MVNLRRIVNLWNQSNVGVVEPSKHKPSSEKRSNRGNDRRFSNWPVSHVKKTCHPIKTWGFGKTKIGDGQEISDSSGIEHRSTFSSSVLTTSIRSSRKSSKIGQVEVNKDEK